MSARTLLIVSVLCSFFYVDAQRTQGMKVLMMPTTYNYPDGTLEGENPQRLSNNSTNLWVVFSDRGNNATFTTYLAATETTKKMKFMEAFYVVEEKGDMIHIVKFDYDAKLFDKKYTLQRDLEDYGWVNKNKMLLWKKGLIDKKTKYSLKALTINSVKSLQDIARYAKGKQLKLYDDSNLGVQNANDVRLFDFLYIFKKENDAYLVGTTNDISFLAAKKANRKILGWVSANNIKEWNQRITLEPNWDSKAVGERKKAKVKTTVFTDSVAAKNFMANCKEPDEKNVFWEKDPYDTRMKMELKRLPILNDNFNNLGSSVIKTGIVTDIFNTEGDRVIMSDQQADIIKEANELRKNLRYINIVFVVDGSEKLRDFKGAIAETMAQTINKIDDLNKAGEDDAASANHFNIGMVIYRDNAERNCADGDMSIQQKDLTSNYAEVLNFFNEEVKMENCRDKDDYQALYKGILTATRMFQEKGRQSNVIILIGAGGNDVNEKQGETKNMVVQQLLKYQVGLLAFQVKHPIAPAYEYFRDQIADILQAEMKQFQDSLNSKFSENKKVSKIKFEDKGNNTFKFDCPKKHPIPGGIMFSDAQIPMEPKKLEDEVGNIFNELIEAKEQILEGMDSRLQGQGRRSDMTPGMYAFLYNMNVPIDLLRKTSYDNYQLFAEGCVTMRCQGLNEDLYKYIVFLTYEELNDIIDKLRSISESGNSASQSRTKMKDAFTTILQNYYGKKEAKVMIKTMDVDQLMSMFTGISSPNSIMKSVKLNDIEDSKKLSNEAFAQWNIQIAEKLEKLQEYKENDKLAFLSNDQRLYWVPLDYFP